MGLIDIIKSSGRFLRNAVVGTALVGAGLAALAAPSTAYAEPPKREEGTTSVEVSQSAGAKESALVKEVVKANPVLKALYNSKIPGTKKLVVFENPYLFGSDLTFGMQIDGKTVVRVTIDDVDDIIGGTRKVTAGDITVSFTNENVEKMARGYAIALPDFVRSIPANGQGPSVKLTGNGATSYCSEFDQEVVPLIRSNKDNNGTKTSGTIVEVVEGLTSLMDHINQNNASPISGKASMAYSSKLNEMIASLTARSSRLGYVKSCDYVLNDAQLQRRATLLDEVIIVDALGRVQYLNQTKQLIDKARSLRTSLTTLYNNHNAALAEKELPSGYESEIEILKTSDDLAKIEDALRRLDAPLQTLAVAREGKSEDETNRDVAAAKPVGRRTKVSPSRPAEKTESSKSGYSSHRATHGSLDTEGVEIVLDVDKLKSEFGYESNTEFKAKDLFKGAWQWVKNTYSTAKGKVTSGSRRGRSLVSAGYHAAKDSKAAYFRGGSDNTKKILNYRTALNVLDSAVIPPDMRNTVLFDENGNCTAAVNELASRLQKNYHSRFGYNLEVKVQGCTTDDASADDVASDPKPTEPTLPDAVRGIKLQPGATRTQDQPPRVKLNPQLRGIKLPSSPGPGSINTPQPQNPHSDAGPTMYHNYVAGMNSLASTYETTAGLDAVAILTGRTTDGVRVHTWDNRIAELEDLIASDWHAESELAEIRNAALAAAQGSGYLARNAGLKARVEDFAKVVDMMITGRHERIARSGSSGNEPEREKQYMSQGQAGLLVAGLTGNNVYLRPQDAQEVVSELAAQRAAASANEQLDFSTTSVRLNNALLRGDVEEAVWYAARLTTKGLMEAEGQVEHAKLSRGKSGFVDNAYNSFIQTRAQYEMIVDAASGDVDLQRIGHALMTGNYKLARDHAVESGVSGKDLEVLESGLAKYVADDQSGYLIPDRAEVGRELSSLMSYVNEETAKREERAFSEDRVRATAKRIADEIKTEFAYKSEVALRAENGIGRNKAYAGIEHALLSGNQSLAYSLLDQNGLLSEEGLAIVESKIQQDKLRKPTIARLVGFFDQAYETVATMPGLQSPAAAIVQVPLKYDRAA